MNHQTTDRTTDSSSDSHGTAGGCEHCASQNSGTERPVRFSNKLIITSVIFLGIAGLSFLPALEPFRSTLFSYIKMIWWAVLLGLVLSGVIDHFVPDGFIMKHLGEGRYRSIFKAVFAGFLLSACSHGILAISMQLYKKGASIPAVIAFLLASPWANLPMTILLFGFFGWQALLFIVAAMVIATTTGFIFLFLESRKLIEPSRTRSGDGGYEWSSVREFDFRESVKGVVRGTVSMSNMVLWWILIGVTAAAVLGTYVPQEAAMKFIGPGITGLLITLAIATVIEICSEGSAPIALEVFRISGGLGNPFVFLMAGVVTDYTEIGILWSNIGKRTAIWLPVITVPQVLAVAVIFNQFF